MKKLFGLFGLAACMAVSGYSYAQDSLTITPAIPDKYAAYDRPLFQRPLSVSLNLGTQGIGLEGKLGIHRRINLRLGVSMLPISQTTVLTLGDLDANVALNGDMTNIRLLAEFRPFNGQFLRITGGLAYFVAANADIDLKPTGTYKYGDLTLQGNTLGNLNIRSDWKGIAPYLGLSLFKGFPKRRVNATLDLGSYYLSKPKVNIESSGMLENNGQNEKIIEENMADYRWLPVLQLSINYRIH